MRVPAGSQIRKGQLEEAMPTVVMLTLSGGLQDAYSYCVRGKVFANAQTGNIVLMSQQFFEGEWGSGIRYLLPLMAFICGIFVAEQIGFHCQRLRTVHWHQLIILCEAVMLFFVGLMPNAMDYFANALVSFACAMQVQTFRTVNGHPYASTMCIGNLRSGTASLSAYLRTGDRQLLKKAGEYFGIILIFAIGTGFGSVLAKSFGTRAIWASSVLLLAGFLLLFVRAEEDDTEVVKDIPTRKSRSFAE